MEKEEPVLCFVSDSGFAFFTTLPLREQWGDDWDDRPYEHNAGPPYRGPSHKIVVAEWKGPFSTPAQRGKPSSRFTVKDINGGEIPWLDNLGGPGGKGARIQIMAGTGLSEFIRLVKSAGGDAKVLTFSKFTAL